MAYRLLGPPEDLSAVDTAWRCTPRPAEQRMATPHGRPRGQEAAPAEPVPRTRPPAHIKLQAGPYQCNPSVPHHL